MQQQLAIVQASILEGTWTPPPARRRGRPTGGGDTGRPLFVREYAERWLQQLEELGCSPNTTRSYRSILDAHILPVLGGDRVVDVTTQSLQAVLDAMGGSATGTKINVLRCASSMLSSAKSDGVIQEVPERPKVARPQSAQRDRIALTATQLTKLIDVADPQVRAAFALASWCCLRYGEVAALQRKHIDMKAWTVTVERAVKRGKGGTAAFGPPKSQAGYRTVAIPQVAQPVIEEHLRDRVGGDDDALLFAREGGWGGVYSDRVLRGYLRRAAAEAGVPEVGLHELRHTGLTLYGQAGATLADLMARAGHADVETVMIYQHSSRVRDRELADRMSGA